MFRSLFLAYSRAPHGLRRQIAKLSPLARFCARPFVKSVHVGGCKMLLDPSDNAAFRYWYYQGKYEVKTTELILQLVSLNPGCIFLDIGAGYGAFALSVANIGRHGLVKKILAFEPDARAHSALIKSVAANGLGPLVFPVRTIVGDYCGSANFLQSSRSSTSNRTFHSSGTAFEKAVSLPCTTIDAFLDDLGIDVSRETFIVKMDIEGNELRAFRGMQRLFDRSKGYAVLFEYYPPAMRDVGIEPADLRAFIDSLRPEILCDEFGINNVFPEMIALDSMAADPHRAVGEFLFGRDVQLIMHSNTVDSGIGRSRGCDSEIVNVDRSR